VRVTLQPGDITGADALRGIVPVRLGRP
jgi:hypothetical protein